MPETIHTSPFHVHSAARPSEKKSSPPNRSHEWYELFSGAVMVSRTYGPSPFPISPLVSICFVHFARPPLMSVVRSSTSLTILLIASALGLTASILNSATLYVVGSVRGGSVTHRRPLPAYCSVTGATNAAPTFGVDSSASLT